MDHKKKHLHPGALWSFRVGSYVLSFFFAIFLVGILAQAVFVGLAMAGISAGVIFAVGVGMFLFFVALVIIVAEIFSRMTYNRWFYEFGPNSLKLERGIIWKKYSNVPYERVQNVDINRGIIARLVGFSSVAIQTAGFSYSPRGGAGAEGSLPAVSIKEAEEIREFLMNKISKNSRSQGM